MPKRLQVISAHPDDLEIGCAGTLLMMQDQGYEISSVITVKPSLEHRPGRDEQTVKSELERSYKQSGFGLRVFDTDLHQNGRPDLRHDNVTMSKLSDLIEPADICILPNPEDFHQDHRNTFALAFPLALKRCRVIWIMHSWPYCYQYEKGRPNLLRNISDYWPAKQKLLECYSSYLDPVSISKIQHLNQVWGDQNGSDFAEAFTVVLDRA
jgi:LmbE family N-acetylglucosaminyl deacetylase